jgi:hypothetical protein
MLARLTIKCNDQSTSKKADWFIEDDLFHLSSSLLPDRPVIVFRFLLLQPFDERSNLFVFLQSFNAVVSSFQLHFGKHRMDFIVADFVQQNRGGAAAAFT